MSRYADAILRSVGWLEESRSVSSDTSVLNLEEFGDLGTPQQIVPAQPRDYDAEYHREYRLSRGHRPQESKEPRKLDLPPGYFDAREAVGPRPRD